MIRKILGTAALVSLLLCQSASAAVSRIQVIVTKARLCKTEIMKKTAYTAKKGEIFTVVQQKGEVVEVQGKAGVKGWIKREQVKPVVMKGKDTFVMDEAKVLGYLENPQAVYILDMKDPNFKPIKLDRSFSDNLTGNIDKETNQRLYDPNLKPEK